MSAITTSGWSPPTPVPFTRLVAVETRKQVDTRAGAWLLAVIVVLCVGVAAVMLVTTGLGEMGFQGLLSSTTTGMTMLLPLIGVMAATGEWTQRTALSTFTLEPRRTRVNMAKVAGAVLLGLAALVVTAAATAVLNASGALLGDGAGSWAVDAPVIGGLTLGLVLLVVQGLAFGLAFLNTAVAIVTYLVLPTAWSLVTSVVTAVQDVAPWLDNNHNLGRLMMGEVVTGEHWAQLGVSSAVWIGVPLAIGLWRTARRDVA